ncbi:hypothetical protein [Gynuella sunshinyii]|uniref:Uncharacterized protein n=1 Tax=Gynuella sunshinyii YC6258 TaxID=1445510 RepID=A0A0C5UZX8_9GAMM|nr:hypothetical protein [Gynuella sunshinyii]AJQ92860.1 hypothetical Protein YC6258_00810 [Gynuella sunshinyii YC6258]
MIQLAATVCFLAGAIATIPTSYMNIDEATPVWPVAFFGLSGVLIIVNLVTALKRHRR